MRRLENAPELLDGPLDADTLRGNLRDLARFNRWLGGQRLSWQAVEPLLKLGATDGAVRLLDIGTGAADIPRYLRRRAGSLRPSLEITGTDVRPEIVTVAQEIQHRSATITVRQGQIENEPDASFDVVHASMVLHHLDRDGAIALLREMARASRRAVVINDLDRGWRWWIGAWILTRLFTRNPYTRNDAPLSVRRAYTADEMADMARAAGLRTVAHYRTGPAYRYALVFVPDSTGK